MGKRVTSPSARDLAIWEARKSGATLREIGAEYGLSHERIRQIVWKTNLMLYTSEALGMYTSGVPIEEITCRVQRKYGFAGSRITSEQLQRLIANRMNCVAPSKHERERCETCLFGKIIRRGHLYECYHPSRDEPYLFYGKTRPHNCPVLQRVKAMKQQAE